MAARFAIIDAKKGFGAHLTTDSRTKALFIAQAALDKKAAEPLILDLQGISIIADYFVICSGENVPQVKAIAENVEEKLRGRGIRPLRVEGAGFAHWILMDYGDVIVHVFERETRAYYELEKLWLDAPRVAFDDASQDLLGRQDKGRLSRPGN